MLRWGCGLKSSDQLSVRSPLWRVALLGLTRVRSPSSRGKFRFRLSVFDVFWALASPLLALFFREAYILSTDGIWSTLLYCFVTFTCSLIAFVAFRIQDGMSRYFSVHDAIQIVKAVAAAELMGGIILFSITRLEGIPRGAPVLHALLLAAGLVAARTFVRMSKTEWRSTPAAVPVATEHVIMIGSTPLTSLYIKFLEAYSSHRYKVIAVLDPNPLQLGRAIAGVRIVGPPEHLQLVMDEFVEHGILVNRVVVGGEADLLSEDSLVELQSACDRRAIRLDFVPRLIGLNEFPPIQPETIPDNRKTPVQTFPVPKYFKVKRVIDFFAASVIVLFLLPVLLVVTGLVFIDVGSPVLFWQQRLGLGGRAFLLQKFRTLRPPFDWRGKQTSPEERLSWIGKLLRNLRLDELPQLLNVLVGDMSLIGPRPLLPHDQPQNPSTRLMVRPGITGWAQVNGGTLLTAEEKDDLDEWYIRNASLLLDLRIMAMTFQFVFRNHRAPEQELVDGPSPRKLAFDANSRMKVACRVQEMGLERKKPRSKILGSR